MKKNIVFTLTLLMLFMNFLGDVPAFNALNPPTTTVRMTDIGKFGFFSAYPSRFTDFIESIRGYVTNLGFALDGPEAFTLDALTQISDYDILILNGHGHVVDGKWYIETKNWENSTTITQVKCITLMMS